MVLPLRFTEAENIEIHTYIHIMQVLPSFMTPSKWVGGGLG